MATRLRSPPTITPKRDVSPLGASKFEKPYNAPVYVGRSSTTTSPTPGDAPPLPTQPMQQPIEPAFTTPRTSTATTSPSLPDATAAHVSKHSLVSNPPTNTTSLTSHSDSNANSDEDLEEADSNTQFEQALDEISNSCPLPEDRDAWFMKHTESDISLPVEDSDDCPDGATLAAAQDIPIYDAAGTPHPFRSLYDPAVTKKQRQLIIFIRHFYCGACQAYVKALVDGITLEDEENIPTPTSIVLIGCGKPDLIPQYRKFTNGCQFPIYAEPTRKLFKLLGMSWSASLGSRPDYMREISVLDVVKGNVRQFDASLKDPEGIRKRDMFRGGHPLQIGGEFLFDGGEVVWCHRMKHMRGHAEVAVLRTLLELDVEGAEGEDGES